MSLPKNQDPIKSSSPSQHSDVPSNSHCAILTGVGRSAVAVIGVRGPLADDAIADGFTPRTRTAYQPGQIRFGRWRDEAVVVTPLGHQSYEIHCHGGPQAASRIVEDLSGSGVQVVDTPRWVAGQSSTLTGEAQLVLVQCLTARTAAVALDQVRGAMADWCQSVMESIDQSGDADSLESIRHQIKVVADRAAFGTRLGEPFRVVFSGPPNVGKSSLVNAMLGYDRSITMDIAGTTRDVLHASTVIDGLPLRLSDTAGLRDGAEAIERQGIEFARKAVTEADLVVFVSDPDRQADETVVTEPSDVAPKKKIHVMNKADLIKPDEQVATNHLCTVATTGQGVPELMQAITSSLASCFPAPGQPVPMNERQAECLRRAASSPQRSLVIEHLRQLTSPN